MILISSNLSDQSTNDVIKWLYASKKEYVRVNQSDNYGIKFKKKK